MKLDKNNIPYQKNWERLLPVKKRVSRALRRQNLPLLVEMVGCNLVDPNIRLCPIERPASLSSYSDNGYSLLHMCVLDDQFDLVKKLLENGADPNIQTYFRETPLHHAARRKSLEIVCLLVEFGGNMLLHPSKRGNYLEDTPVPKNALDAYEEATGHKLTLEDVQKHILKKQLHGNLSETYFHPQKIPKKM